MEQLRRVVYQGRVWRRGRTDKPELVELTAEMNGYAVWEHMPDGTTRLVEFFPLGTRADANKYVAERVRSYDLAD